MGELDFMPTLFALKSEPLPLRQELIRYGVSHLTGRAFNFHLKSPLSWFGREESFRSGSGLFYEAFFSYQKTLSTIYLFLINRIK